jgi:hypothetical protein
MGNDISFLFWLPHHAEQLSAMEGYARLGFSTTAAAERGVAVL